MKLYEQAIVHALCAHLDRAGYVPVSVVDPEGTLTTEERATPDPAAIIGFVDDVDMLIYRVLFREKGKERPSRWLEIIDGNGEDLLHDYGCTMPADDFSGALEHFDASRAVLAMCMDAWKAAVGAPDAMVTPEVARAFGVGEVTKPGPLPQSSLDRCIASAVEAGEGSLRALDKYLGGDDEPLSIDRIRVDLNLILDALDDGKIGATLRAAATEHAKPW